MVKNYSNCGADRSYLAPELVINEFAAEAGFTLSGVGAPGEEPGVNDFGEF